MYTVNGVIFDFDAFHILTADVKNAVHIRLKKRSGIIVGHGLHFSLVQKQGRLDQSLAVSGGAGVYDLHLLRQLAVNVFDRTYGSSQGIPVIVVVERIKKSSVFSHKRCFRGSRACINSKEGFSFIGAEILDRYLVFVVAVFKCVVICLACE